MVFAICRTILLITTPICALPASIASIPICANEVEAGEEKTMRTWVVVWMIGMGVVMSCTTAWGYLEEKEQYSHMRGMIAAHPDLVSLLNRTTGMRYKVLLMPNIHFEGVHPEHIDARYWVTQPSNKELFNETLIRTHFPVGEDNTTYHVWNIMVTDEEPTINTASQQISLSIPNIACGTGDLYPISEILRIPPPVRSLAPQDRMVKWMEVYPMHIGSVIMIYRDEALWKSMPTSWVTLLTQNRTSHRSVLDAFLSSHMIPYQLIPHVTPSPVVASTYFPGIDVIFVNQPTEQTLSSGNHTNWIMRRSIPIAEGLLYEIEGEYLTSLWGITSGSFTYGDVMEGLNASISHTYFTHYYQGKVHDDTDALVYFVPTDLAWQQVKDRDSIGADLMRRILLLLIAKGPCDMTGDNTYHSLDRSGTELEMTLVEGNIVVAIKGSSRQLIDTAQVVVKEVQPALQGCVILIDRVLGEPVVEELIDHGGGLSTRWLVLILIGCVVCAAVILSVTLSCLYWLFVNRNRIIIFTKTKMGKGGIIEEGGEDSAGASLVHRLSS